jgi:hypothetical protein
MKALKNARKERAQAAEQKVHRALRDRTRSPAARATAACSLLAEKMIADVEEQHALVLELRTDKEAEQSYVDAEVSRLLRMLEKRAKVLEKILPSCTLSG